VKLDAPAAGEAFRPQLSARGLPWATSINDGYPDVVIANSGEAPLVLRNTRSAEGAKAGLDYSRREQRSLITWSADRVEAQPLKTSGGSYLSLTIHESCWASALQRNRLAGGPLARSTESRDRFQNVAAGKYYAFASGGRSNDRVGVCASCLCAAVTMSEQPVFPAAAVCRKPVRSWPPRSKRIRTGAGSYSARKARYGLNRFDEAREDLLRAQALSRFGYVQFLLASSIT